MIFNMIGGGSGAGLNFKVVGGTAEPVLPSENMIWINTDVEITNWYFSTEEPDVVEEGIIWIKIYKYSTVEFNALKENGVYLRPLCAKQCISGAWVDKSAKIYQNGEWVDWWNGELYLTGNEFTDITGGWYGMDAGLSTSNVNITKIESGLKLHLTANNRKIGIMATRKPIDLTDYNTITFTGYIFKSTASTSGKEAYGYLMVYSDISGGSLTQVARADISNGGKPTTITINVSNLKGFYNICPYMYSFDASAPYMVMNSLILS